MERTIHALYHAFGPLRNAARLDCHYFASNPEMEGETEHHLVAYFKPRGRSLKRLKVGVLQKIRLARRVL
jgi:hypothetical protein